MRKLYPNFDSLPEEEKEDLLEKTALQYQDLINNFYNTFSKETFNVESHHLKMKTEAIIRSAYFRATRRYAQWITKQEGIKKDFIDIKGLEFKKANFPPVLGSFFGDILEKILKGSKKEEIDKQILFLRNQVIKGEISLEDLGNPTSINTLNKYIKSKPLKGQIFSSFYKKAPAAVKASVLYNDLLKFWKLNNKHSYISQGDKVKWVYLKPNPYKIEAISFLGFDFPPKMKEFIETYVDRKKIFDSILLNKLTNFYSDLGWELQLNPHISNFFNFD